ncbi:MAG: type II secretion system protein [Burkholderiales bacterium]
MTRRPLMRSARGFTLLELVTVILILGILAAVTAASFNQKSIDQTWFLEQVKSAVRYAQKTAIAQRRVIYVTVNPSAPYQLSLCYDAACTSPVSSLASSAAFVLTPPSGVILSASASPFNFNGLGQPSAAVTLAVNGRPVSVSVETGYVQ